MIMLGSFKIFPDLEIFPEFINSKNWQLTHYLNKNKTLIIKNTKKKKTVSMVYKLSVKTLKRN